MDYMVLAVLGLGSGAVVALLSLGITLGYRGSGVVNFSQGGIAMYAAYTYYDLKVNGTLFVPLAFSHEHIRLTSGGGLPPWLATVISVVIAAILGGLLHLLVLRPLRNAPTLAKVVGSIGVLLVLQSTVILGFGTNILTVPSMLPQSTAFTISGTSIPADRITLVALCVLVALLIGTVSKFTRFGLATRAAAENELGAVLIGYSPNTLSSVNWILSGAMAGIAGIVIAPIVNLSPTQFSLLIVPALAAALVARFSTLWLTVVAGMCLGMVQSLLNSLPNQLTWLPSTGLSETFLFVVIAVVMFWGGRTVPTRETATDTKLAPALLPRRPYLTGGIGIVVMIVALLLASDGLRLALITSLVMAIACLSLVVVTGFVGQISLFQLSISGIAAFMLSEAGRSWGIPFPLSMLLAVVIATIVGMISAIPALRVRGVNLAVLTFAAGWAVDGLYFNNSDYTGGLTGATVADPSLFGFDFGFTKGTDIARPVFGIFVLIVLAIVGFAVVNARRNNAGRRMLAVRANERAAAALGISISGTKIMAFGVGAFIAGLAGALMAFQQSTVAPTSFSVFLSLGLLAVAYLGGITSVSGAVIGGLSSAGGLVFYLLQTYVFSHTANGVDLMGLIAGLGLVLTAVLNPVGIAGAIRQTGDRIRAGAARRRAALAGPGGSGTPGDEGGTPTKELTDATGRHAS